MQKSAASTADLYDAHLKSVQVCGSAFRGFDNKTDFSGPIRMLKVFEDFLLVKETLESDGAESVLIIDGGGSLRCAMLGGTLMQPVIDNDWAENLINGCVRDGATIGTPPIGVKALATQSEWPSKGGGQADIPAHFARVVFHPGHFLYADVDGALLSETDLLGITDSDD
jgi:regulator of ribonuclease activity A